MSQSELAATFEEDLQYDCNPLRVLAAIKSLKERVAKYQADEPGEYQIGDLDCRWSTSDLRARWKLSQSLWRVAAPSADPAVPSKRQLNVAHLSSGAAVASTGELLEFAVHHPA